MAEQTFTHKIKLKEDSEKALAGFLTQFWDNNHYALGPFYKAVKEWRDLYEGSTEPSWTPWNEASKIFFPLPQLIADTARARIFQTFFQQKEKVAVQSPMKPSVYANMNNGADLRDDLGALRRGLDKLLDEEDEVNIKDFIDDVLAETTQIGTAITRTHFEKKTIKKKKRVTAEGEVEEIPDYVLCSGVKARVIPPELCVWDVTADTEEEIRAWGFEFNLSKIEVEQLAKDQKWDEGVKNDILAAPVAQLIGGREDIMKRAHQKPVISSEVVIKSDGTPVRVASNATYCFREVHLRNMDIDNDGAYEDSVLTWHPGTGRIPYAVLFPDMDGEPGFAFFWYERRRSRPHGRGTIEPIARIAAGVNAVANQTIDAQTIRNCPTIVTRENTDADDELANGWKPGMILHESQANEVRALEFGQTGNTTVSMSIFHDLIEIAFRVSHLGPGQFGDVTAAQRVPSDVGQSIMVESARLLDKVVNNTRRMTDKHIQKVFSLYWQYQRDKFAAVVGQEDFEAINRLVTSTGIDKLKVTVRTTSATHSPELERQNFAGMMQLVGGNTQAVLGTLAQATQGTPGPDGQMTPPHPLLLKVIPKLIRANQEFLQDFVEMFPDITEADKYIPDIASDVEAEAEKALGGQEGQQGEGQQGGGGQPPFQQPVQDLGPGSIGPGAGAITPAIEGF